jgi:heme exporter protein B
MMLKARGREVLFPLLYFPLAIPVLLAGSEAVLSFVENADSSPAWQWIGLLAGFDVIFITLSALLYGELVSTER